MAEIRLLTPELLRAAAREKAAQGVPLNQANDYIRGTELWHQYNAAYRDAEIATHDARRTAEREVATC